MTWKERLTHANQTGTFTVSDMERVESWLTCAVGEKLDIPNQAKLHPILSIDDLVPDSLRKPGIEFTYYVRLNDVSNATACYARINNEYVARTTTL